MFEDMAQKLVAVLPDGLQSIQRDVEKNFKTVLQSSFAKMDLVTREEFDVQTAVLSRSREKLEALEKQVAQLEALIGESHQQNSEKN
jgi:BMFP domain-containing protein YqiC